MDAPHFPIGPHASVPSDDARRRQWISDIERVPNALRDAVRGLTEAQLETPYRNWTVRQIAHHVADSHLNSYVRFKWTLTEATPTIKAYDEGRWSTLPDARLGDVGPSLDLLGGLHARWVTLLRAMSDSDFAKAFVHPETKKTVRLDEAVSYYAWHGRHHTAQILWLRDQHVWNGFSE